MSARDALIDATRTLLSTKGYEATSPADIQHQAGVGQGSFYHHFNGKAELANAALQALAADMCDEFDRISDDHGIDAITNYLALPRNASAGCRIGRICMESSLDDDRIRVPIATYFDHLRTQLRDTFAELELGIDPSALADLTIATVQGAYVTARATADPSTMTSATTALIALLTNTINHPIPPRTANELHPPRRNLRTRQPKPSPSDKRAR